MEINDWSITAASNNFTVPDGFPENMQYSGVNNSAREIMAVLSRWQKDTSGSIASTGSADAYVVAANRVLSAYYVGLRMSFQPNFANTGACTLDVDAVGAQSIKTPSGADPLAGALDTDAVVDVVYDGTNWILIAGASAMDFAALTVTSTATFAGATIADLGTVAVAEITDLTVGSDATFAGATIADLGTVTTADIDGGTADGVVMGGATPAAGTFTTLTATGALTVARLSTAGLYQVSAAFSNVSSVALDLSVLLPEITLTSRYLTVELLIRSNTNSSNHRTTKATISRSDTGVWSTGTLFGSSAVGSGGTVSSVSGSGTTVTVTFSTGSVFGVVGVAALSNG